MIATVTDDRARAFAEMRRRNNITDAARTASERLEDAQLLLDIAAQSRRAPAESRSDESLEIWRRLKERARR